MSHLEAIFININAFSVSGFLFTSEGRGVTASHLSWEFEVNGDRFLSKW